MTHHRSAEQMFQTKLAARLAARDARKRRPTSQSAAEQAFQFKLGLRLAGRERRRQARADDLRTKTKYGLLSPDELRQVLPPSSIGKVD